MSLAADVRRGLTLRPKELPPRHFYDALGSRLFEAICHLPSYEITRAEKRLLSKFAGHIVEPLPPPLSLVELGCGNGEKLALVVDVLLARGDRRIDVRLVDLSKTALEESLALLSPRRAVRAGGDRASFLAGLRRAAAGRTGRGPMLVLFLGSNIGNFDPQAAASFLRAIRRALRPDDALLLGADLVKPEARLLLAYDDPLGVTAAFNKNLLVRMNRELGADFDVGAFSHEARWNRGAARIELHLVSRRAQRVSIPGAGIAVRFGKGESIFTESSHKYTPGGIHRMMEGAGFRAAAPWIDARARFALTLSFAA